MNSTVVHIQENIRNPKIHREPDLPGSGNILGNTGSGKHIKRE